MTYPTKWVAVIRCQNCGADGPHVGWGRDVKAILLDMAEQEDGWKVRYITNPDGTHGEMLCCVPCLALPRYLTRPEPLTRWGRILRCQGCRRWCDKEPAIKGARTMLIARAKARGWMASTRRVLCPSCVGATTTGAAAPTTAGR